MWKPKLTISGTELIVPRPELIICEAKLTVSKAKAIISEPHLIVCVTHTIISDTGSVRLGATAPPVKFLKASLPRTNPHFGECGRRAGHFRSSSCAESTFPEVWICPRQGGLQKL